MVRVDLKLSHFAVFLMDKEGRHDEEMVKAIDDVVAFIVVLCWLIYVVISWAISLGNWIVSLF